jgi:ribosome-binding protein aMBF1 (putative translation factor)
VADERVSADLKKNIMQARLDKKLTQAQLAQVLMASYYQVQHNYFVHYVQ